jgi:hypothetical protein
MKNIKYFLKEEAQEGEKLKHIEHLEDHPINDGAKGFEHAVGALEKVKHHIQQKKNDSDLTMKHDGSPSIVYGHHPENGKFFVASKSAFNKTPKINYTDKDIEKNHGHAPGLVEKLKAALHHIPKIVPKKGVFQGDMLFSPGDVKHEGGKVHFKPNTITYSAKENGEEGKKIANAKVGLYTHTEYRGKDATAMSAHFDPDLSKFKNHPDVYHREPGHDTSKTPFKPDEKANYEKHLKAAEDIHAKHGEQMYGPLSKEKDHVKTYINSTVRTGEKPSPEGLQHHITTNYGKAIDKLKTPAAKNKKSDELKQHLTHIEVNKEHFNNAFKMHHHLQQAKDQLVHVLAKHTGGLEHTVGGQKVKPEGFVVNHEGSPTKLNDRKEFNRLNFLARK